jgi:membrane-bound serine protease (ClpP class)
VRLARRFFGRAVFGKGFFGKGLGWLLAAALLGALLAAPGRLPASGLPKAAPLNGAPPKALAATPKVIALKAEGVVNPALADLVERTIERAQAEKAAALIIELDTPGGLDTSMRQIIKAIMNSPLPVIVWVGPSGARAASAGVMIVMSADVAAMAPGTNIGAASPVTMGGGDIPKTMARKVVNDMVAYGRSIAARRGRNADWVERAVRESVSITAGEAVRLHVVDLEAADTTALLASLDGRKLAGKGEALKLAGARVETVEESVRGRVLAIISDPNIAYLLLMIGLAGIYFELSTPGAVLPGVVGAICLILAFFALQTMPISFAGVALIVLALILFVAEIKVASHGVLAVGGTISLVLGSLMLFSSPELYMRISLGVILPTALAFSLFFALVVRLAVKAHRAKPLTGERGIVGEIGHAVGPIEGEGKVFVHGEHWNAVAAAPIEAGARVRVVAVEDLTLKVEKA